MNTERTNKQIEELLCADSDEFHDYTCSPCSKEKKHISASKYCKDCGNYLCQACVIQHGRFEAMRVHEVLDISDKVCAMAKGGGVSTLPTLKCSVHHGKLLEMYCNKHNDVCCIICMTVKHSSCKDMTYIPTIAKDADSITKINGIRTSLKDIKSTLVTLQEKKKNVKEKMMSQTKAWKAKIQEERKMVMGHVDNIEVQLNDEINQKADEIVTSAETHSNEIDNFITQLERDENQMSSAKSNLSDLFIKSVQIENQLQQVKDLHRKVQRKAVSPDQLYLRPNKNLSNQLKGIDSLGELVFSKSGSSSDVCIASFFKNVNVLAVKEEMQCDISGACVLTNGNLLLVDCKNRSLKRLDDSYEISCIFKMSAIPWSICTVNSTTVAVTMWNAKEVQFVWVQGDMKFCSYFRVSDRCSGIYHKDEKLYVCVGGMENGLKGVVEVYDLSGKKLRTISCSLEKPRSVVVLDNNIFVADEEYGIVEIKIDGNTVLHNFSDLKEAQSLCVAPDGNILVCGMSSNNVLCFSVDDGMFKPVLSRRDGIIKPQLLCLHPERSRLLMGIENSNFLKVYSFNRNF